MSVALYDPKQISVIVGVKPLSGFAEDSVVKVERNEDTFTVHVGADGETSRVRNHNKSGKVTVSLAPSSQSNDYLSELAIADELSNGGVVPLLVKDNLGTSKAAAATAWITKPASFAFGKDAGGAREWVFETDELEIFIGGSNR